MNRQRWGRPSTITARAFAGSGRGSLLVLSLPLTYSQLGMQDRTETLKVGSQSPEFSLSAANRGGSIVTLSALREQGPVVIEFLRGTW